MKNNKTKSVGVAGFLSNIANGCREFMNSLGISNSYTTKNRGDVYKKQFDDAQSKLNDKETTSKKAQRKERKR